MTGGLSPAHQGYQYQDLVTAYFLVRSIVEQFDEVTVDRKRHEGDRFDDIEIRADSGLIRRLEAVARGRLGFWFPDFPFLGKWCVTSNKMMTNKCS
jgi:hypothetical protein